MIVQIIGSWCPNCMDETRFMAQLYREYHQKGLEIIALCYESADYESSVKAMKRFKEGTGAPYTFLYAGEASKRKAALTLPMLNRIVSYPTAIFIDRHGEVRKIFTGFSGPGTGEYYRQLTEEIRKLVHMMTREK